MSQSDLFLEDLARAPNTWAWGVGVDSTAGIIEMHARGETIDMVLTADMPERQETFKFRELFIKWMREREIPCEIVSYQPKRFKDFPPYYNLLTNCLTNGTLPSIAFGFSSCSSKWKAGPQDAWMANWSVAQQAWNQGMKVVKNIGYDAGGRDSQRYAHAEGYQDDRYDYRYPLREYGWTRKECEERIVEELGFSPPKSSCFFCTASKPAEIDLLTPTELRLIVLLEARAAPRLRNVEGLWRKSTKGMRGAVAKPGSMTEYIRQKSLLPAEQIDQIVRECPTALITWQEIQANVPIEERPELQIWVDFFDRHAGSFYAEGARELYGTHGYEMLRDRLSELQRKAA